MKTTETSNMNIARIFARVRNFVSNAQRDGVKQLDKDVAKNKIDELIEMEKELTRDFYDRAKIDETINRAGDIFKAQGMFV